MTEVEASDPLEELVREHDVIRPVLARMVELGEALQAGTMVSPGEIATAIDLLDGYLHRLHASRVDAGLLPEARPVAMTTCFEHLAKIPSDHANVREKAAQVRSLLEPYAKDPATGKGALGSALVDLASADHDLMTYEETYPFSCLVAALPDDASARVRSHFDQDRPHDLADFEEHIRRFLARPQGASEPLAVGCSEAGCDERGEAHLRPADGGRLGIEVPSGGWGATAQPPRREAGGVVRSRVDFVCPTHHGMRQGVAGTGTA